MKDAVRILSSYSNQDQEIFIEWWDRRTAEGNAQRSLTDDEWLEVILFMEDFEPTHGTNSLLVEKVREIAREEKV